MLQSGAFIAKIGVATAEEQILLLRNSAGLSRYGTARRYLPASDLYNINGVEWIFGRISDELQQQHVRFRGGTKARIDMHRFFARIQQPPVRAG